MSAWSTGKTAAFVLAALCAASPAEAQTWVGKRTRPHLGELFALDKTGETGWLYGEEDLAGDGLGSFKQPEQSVDLRTAYAANDGTRFWTRVYVSDPAVVAANIKVFVFIDADQNDTTGGSAVATDIDPKLVQDTPAVGFEYVIEMHSDGTVAQIWTWQQAMGKFVATVPQATQVQGEVGKDRDPIRLNGLEHGYVQGAVDFGLIGLTSVCKANLYVRSVNTVQDGPSDLDVGLVVPCEPADANSDGVPDIVITGGCSVDTDCAGDGFCDNSVCVIATGCAVDTDCSADTQCSVDIDVCVARPGGSCSVSADCGDLVCDNGGCVACAFGGDQCGTDRRCSLGGLCVEGSVTSVGVGGSVGAGGSVTAGVGVGAGAGSGSSGGGPNVQGGACSCGLVGNSGRGSLAALLLSLSLPLGALFRRRRRSPGSSGGQQG